MNQAILGTHLIGGETVEGGGGDLIGVCSLQMLQRHGGEDVCSTACSVVLHARQGSSAGERRRKVRVLEV